MLSEDDAVKALERVRERMIESGFEIFDEHAFMLISERLEHDGDRVDGRLLLNGYLRITEALLRSVGRKRIENARMNLGKHLGDGHDIEIDLDTRQVESILRTPNSPFVRLDGFEEADVLADGLADILRAANEFEYPTPDSDNDTPTP